MKKTHHMIWNLSHGIWKPITKNNSAKSKTNSTTQAIKAQQNTSNKTTPSLSDIKKVAVAIPFVFSGSTSFAAEECGPDGAGSTVLICNAASYAGGTAFPNFTTGITYTNTLDAFTLNLNDPTLTVDSPGVSVSGDVTNSGAILINGTSFNTITTTGISEHGLAGVSSGLGNVATTLTSGTVSTSGNDAFGVYSDIDNATSTATSAVMMNGGSVTTLGTRAHGIYAINAGLGDTAATLTAGNVSVSEYDATGVYAKITNSSSVATVTSTMNGGTVTTNLGTLADGVVAQNNGLGNATATLSGGDVTTEGLGGHAVWASVNNNVSTATATAIMTGGTITTTGDSGRALESQNNGLGESHTTMDAGVITTSGVGGHGVWALGNNAASSATVTATMNGGTVITSGDNSQGLSADHNGSGTVIVTLNAGTVTMSGANSDGVLAKTVGGTFDVNVNAGTVTGGTGQAAGIRTMAAAGGTVDIAAGAVINGTASGIAIRDGDANHDGVDEIGGNVVVTTAGIISGNAILGLGNDTFNLTGGSYTGTIYGDDIAASGSDGDDVFNWTGGSLIGGFSGQNGSDTAVVSAAEYNGTQVLDGGDDTLTADGWIDTLTLQNMTVSTNGANITNWETLTVNGGTLTIQDGALSVGSDAGQGLFLSGGGNFDAANALALTGNLNIATGSSFIATGAGTGVYSITGNVSNAGTITTQDGAAGDVITLNGNYSGNGGKLLFDTKLGGDSSPTDKLVINGNASGSTQVAVNNAGGLGAHTVNGIELIQVNGTNSGTFTLAGPVQAGISEYQLVQKGNNLFLDNHYNGTTESYRPAVPAYVIGQQDNAELGFATFGSLHKRMGEQQTLKWDNCTACNETITPTTHQAWGRIGGAKTDLAGKKRFDLTQNYYFVQLGMDLFEHYGENDQSRVTGGVMGSYGRSDSDFSDRNRPLGGLSAKTGSMDSQQISLGGYYTRYADNGSYLDLVGQLSSIHNKYRDIYSTSAKQSGLGLGLSAEVGRPWQLGESQWLIEPQAQLSYQLTHYGSFNDGISDTDSYNGNNLRGRLGTRLTWNDRLDRTYQSTTVHRTETFYLTANLLADLLNPETVTIGGSELSEEINYKPWAELGVGGQLPVSKEAYLYANLNYERSLSNDNIREGVSGSVGLRVAW